ncbi:MAG: type IV secretory system conjugative DNA transfer family protein, partial [Bacteroidia bacterium]
MIYLSEKQSKKNHHQACFGFELMNINKPLISHSELHIREALSWHQLLLNALSNYSIDFHAEIRMRRQFSSDGINKPSIGIAILFFVTGNTAAEANEKASALHKDMLHIFQTDNRQTNNMYLFAAIETEEHLDRITTVPVSCRTFDYRRKEVQYKPLSSDFGFRKQSYHSERIANIPAFFSPDLSAINKLARHMAHSSLFLDLKLQLRPVSLPDHELAALKKISETHILVDELFSKQEKETYESQLQHFFESKTSHFLFHVSLTVSESDSPGQALHNQIADTFFGNILNVEICSEENSFFMEETTKYQFRALLPYIYPGKFVRQCFRLPLVNGEIIDWFSNKADIFNYQPINMPDDGVLMGMKREPSKDREVRMTRKELAQHVYILGQTGVGKTTLLQTMIMDQIMSGDGLCVVDPHGDLVAGIQKMIPFERLQDVVYFDPTANTDIRINILEWHPHFPEQKTFIFNELIRIIGELYDLDRVGGPMFEQCFKNALLMVMEVRGTLHDFYRFFLEKAYRDKLIEWSKLKTSVDFFKTQFRLTGEYSFENWVSYITSKVNRFVQDDFIAPIIRENKSNISFRHIIDSKKILLVRLPKGRLGSDGVKFIGTLLFNRIIMAAFTRENIPAAERVPFYMYIDEFQNFTTEDIETALSESRKYGLRMILANQTLSQLRPNVVKILLGNVGSQIIFRPGPFDSEVVAPCFKHDIS